MTATMAALLAACRDPFTPLAVQIVDGRRALVILCRIGYAVICDLEVIP
jgi:hypothetical protein